MDDKDRDEEGEAGVINGFKIENGLNQPDLSIQSLCDIASKHGKFTDRQSQLDQHMLQITLAMKCYKQA